MRINLTDNSLSKVFNRKDVKALFPIADKTIYELCEDNENLLIFPHNLELSNDGIGDANILNLQNTSDPDIIRITTGNIMGFIGVGGLRIKIRSRFDNGRDDYLLHYMLQKVLSFNVIDLNHNNEQENVFDFLMFIFPYYLKNALRQGLYREYQNYEHNDSNLRGTINVGKHISRNIPFVGNIAYSTREYSHDNSMMQLIRHTIEFMKNKRYGCAVLDIDRDTIDSVKIIIEHTQSYDKGERANVISKNLRFKSHPYYTEYKPLQSLCLQILRMEEVKYGDCEDKISGILFDGAWLWEEYVNTILRAHGFKHPENKKKKGGIALFEDRQDDGKIHWSGIRYPDFYKKDIVLDTKYKKLGNYEKVSKVDRNDVHQVITYMQNIGASKGGFVVPLESKQTAIPISHLKNSASTVAIYGIEICKTAISYNDFCKKMKEMEDVFVHSIFF